MTGHHNRDFLEEANNTYLAVWRMVHIEGHFAEAEQPILTLIEEIDKRHPHLKHFTKCLNRLLWDLYTKLRQKQ